jgi:hypothetical protein
MKTLNIDKTEATLLLSAEEIFTINNSINEALEALANDPDEFQIRVGVTVPVVRELLAAINAVARQMV